MFLQKAYGKGTATAVFALLMYFSIVINESLVARTFGQYTVQIINTYGTNIGLSQVNRKYILSKRHKPSDAVNVMRGQVIFTLCRIAAIKGL